AHDRRRAVADFAATCSAGEWRGHAMDFDLNTAGQSVAGVIPAILPVAETTGATPAEMLAAFIVAAEVAARLFRAAPQGWRNTSWHGTGTIGTTAAAIASARL